MTKINILTAGATSPNGMAFIFPLIKFSRALREAGCNISFFHALRPEIKECDVLILDGKFFRKDWGVDRFNATLETFASLTENMHAIYCDQQDSSGCLVAQVLPHVKKYAKAQVLANRQNYLERYQADRIYADYYQKKYQPEPASAPCFRPVENPRDLDKITVSWNSGLMPHGLWGPYITRLARFFPYSLFPNFSAATGLPDAMRPIPVSCRMGVHYPRPAIALQRLKIRERLSHMLPSDKVSRRDYIKELCQSKIVISPFGYGEITLKDFEVFLAGGLLLKPDMSHLETWPNFYQKNLTYAAFDWSLDNLVERITECLEQDTQRTTLAHTGQDMFLRHTRSADAAPLFAQHFMRLINKE